MKIFLYNLFLQRNLNADKINNTKKKRIGCLIDQLVQYSIVLYFWKQ